jgi:hypothetical protein
MRLLVLWPNDFSWLNSDLKYFRELIWIGL